MKTDIAPTATTKTSIALYIDSSQPNAVQNSFCTAQYDTVQPRLVVICSAAVH
jgi:hypothetical protein